PTAVNNKVPVGVAKRIENEPSSAVSVLTVAFSKDTVTPANGFPFSSNTVPLTLCCACTAANVFSIGSIMMHPSIISDMEIDRCINLHVLVKCRLFINFGLVLTCNYLLFNGHFLFELGCFDYNFSWFITIFLLQYTDSQPFISIPFRATQ